MLSGVFGGVGTAEENVATGILAFRSMLMSWYKTQVYRHEHIFIAVLIVGLVWVGTYVQTKRSQLRSLPG